MMRGSFWVLLGYGGGQLLRLGGNLVLWRLLYAEAFGLMALVNVFMQGLAMFSDVGIGPSIIQSPRGEEPNYQNTAWTIQVARGFALCLTAWLLARPVAAFYGEPELASLIPIVALGAVIAGFNATRMFTATRRVALGRLTLIDLGAQCVGLAVMMGWGLVYRNIWALVVGGLVTNLLRLGFGHLALPGIRNRFHWDRECAQSLMHFGRWIFLSTLLAFAVAQSDRLIFGKLVPMGLLGVYSIANTWANLPATVIDHIFNSVVFPLLSRAHDETGKLAETYVTARRPWLLLCGWGAAGLIAVGPSLIHLLYDERASSAGWLVQVLAVSTWFYGLETANSTALLALGKSNWVAIGSAAKLVGMVICIPVGLSQFGFPGAVAGLAASELLRYITSVIGVRRLGIGGAAEDLLLSVVVAATAFMGLLVGAELRGPLAAHHLGGSKLGAGIQLVVVGAAVSVAWLALLLVLRRRQPTAT